MLTDIVFFQAKMYHIFINLRCQDPAALAQGCRHRRGIQIPLTKSLKTYLIIQVTANFLFAGYYFMNLFRRYDIT